MGANMEATTLKASFQTAIATAATQVTTVSRASNGLSLTLDPAATGPVYVGGSNVTSTTGQVLEAGVPLFLPCRAPGEVYAILPRVVNSETTATITGTVW